MRRYREQMSCSEWLSAWPMCSSPVMFGGGRQIVYLGLGLFASAVNRPASSQRVYQPASVASWSYDFGMSVMVLLIDVFGLGVDGRGRRLPVASLDCAGEGTDTLPIRLMTVESVT